MAKHGQDVKGLFKAFDASYEARQIKLFFDPEYIQEEIDKVLAGIATSKTPDGFYPIEALEDYAYIIMLTHRKRDLENKKPRSNKAIATRKRNKELREKSI